MQLYSQNGEDFSVLIHFNEKKGSGFKGNLLSIGENNGIDLSNARLLALNGWGGDLIEPGTTFKQLQELYKGSDKIRCFNLAIGEHNGKGVLMESGAHILGGNDHGLVSSLKPSETERWKSSGVKFTPIDVKVQKFSTFWNQAGKPKYDFISIDCEGHDLAILQQMDLNALGCSCLCIEWNGGEDIKKAVEEHLSKYGTWVLFRQNRENLIYIR